MMGDMQNGWTSPCAGSPDEQSGDAEDMLVRELVAGSNRAWREFHARYDRVITAAIARVTARFRAVVTQDDVRDVYATLVVQLISNDMRKLRSFDAARGSLGSWLSVLAANCAYDLLRSMRRRPSALPLTEVETLCCDRPSPAEQAERRERERLVSDLLRALSDKDCEFVALYFGEGLAPEQVAARMQISVKTVYSKRFKIQNRLEAMLAEGSLAA
jgi:RNA polymerase sigma-70 factor, ECF subfamily